MSRDISDMNLDTSAEDGPVFQGAPGLLKAPILTIIGSLVPIWHGGEFVYKVYLVRIS